MRKVYHVTATDDGSWKVKATDASRAAAVEQHKDDAVDKARDLAKGHSLGQVVVHKADGTIQTEYTYGKDPRCYRG